jgi:peptidoglycan hydrolase-like protein with peptidoglycan-binding domain
MKTSLAVALSLLFVLSIGVAAQNANPSTTSQSSASTKSTRKRAPVFRSSKEQINQAQAILKDRGLYNGGQTGKLDTATRDGLKKYQEAEKLKVTGTLNRVTLEKMGIALTDKQRTM